MFGVYCNVMYWALPGSITLCSHIRVAILQDRSMPTLHLKLSLVAEYVASLHNVEPLLKPKWWVFFIHSWRENLSSCINAMSRLGTIFWRNSFVSLLFLMPSSDRPMPWMLRVPMVMFSSFIIANQLMAAGFTIGCSLRGFSTICPPHLISFTCCGCCWVFCP